MSLGILSPRTEILQRLLQFGPKSLTDASQAAVGVALTVLILATALVAPLVYVAFYATNYSFFQKVVVVLVSLILAVAAVAAVGCMGGAKRIQAVMSPHAQRVGRMTGCRQGTASLLL